MKKILAILLCLLTALGLLTGCTGETPQVSATPSATEAAGPTETPTPTPDEPSVVLTIASASKLTDTAKGDALEKAFSDIKDWSKGVLSMDFYEGGEKGTDHEIINAVKSGDISIYVGSASMIADVVPQLAVLDIPMMFSSIEDCNTVLGGAFTDMIQPYFNEAGMQLLGAYSTSFRYFTSTEPITAPEGFNALSMTTSKSKYNQLFWKTVGCNVLPLERSQVYIALKQGMHKAQEDTYSEIYTLKLYEVQTALIKTRHAQSVNLFVMNKAAYDALTDEQKGWLKQFAEQVIKDETAAVAEEETDQEETFVKKKMTVSEPTAEVLAALKAAVQPVIDAVKETVDPALVDGYVDACKKAQGTSSPAPTEAPGESAQPAE